VCSNWKTGVKIKFSLNKVHWFRKLNLVDLAGSESVKANDTLSERFKEAKTINSDLLELGIVIRKENKLYFGCVLQHNNFNY
jgi:hypothetical protein